jgi:hypothetical protein
MTISIKPTATDTTIQNNGSDIFTIGSGGITMASGKTLPASALTGSLPAGMGGKVLQVLQAVKSDAFSTTSTSLIDVSGLSVSITPSSTSSKILVHVDLFLSASYFIGQAQLVRGTTQIYKADSAGSRPTNSITFSQNPSNDGISQRSSIMYLDSPSTTSATTYKVQASTRIDGQGGGVFYINRTTQDRDTVGYDARGVSSITVMEIAG